LTKKTKILTLSDHPFSPSGVGTQTKYFITALLDTGRYSVVSLGGAIKHQDYTPTATQEYKDDWRTYPVDGYGTADQVRSVMANERPDVVWFMTDPRFWGWLWMIENEIRPYAPMVYYHVWDNYPYPKFNKKFYDSNDAICTISGVTDDIVRTLSPSVDCYRIPHAVPPEIFRPLDPQEVTNYRTQHAQLQNGKFIFFWNNRNARRKQSGTLIYWFKEFLEIVGRDKACLIMHTDPKDVHGQDLTAILEDTGLTNEEVLLSTLKLEAPELAMIYNLADCTINISDAEGFGLSTLESLNCGTPIIATMTGGLQEQVTDGENWFGVGIEPASKSIIGSQDVPYIYEDRICKEDFLQACLKMYNMTPEQRKEVGEKGRQHALTNFGFDKYAERWISAMDEIVEHHGSWDTRKNYQSWNLKKV